MTPNYFATILISFYVRILLFMSDVNSTYKSILIHIHARWHSNTRSHARTHSVHSLRIGHLLVFD